MLPQITLNPARLKAIAEAIGSVTSSVEGDNSGVNAIKAVPVNISEDELVTNYPILMEAFFQVAGEQFRQLRHMSNKEGFPEILEDNIARIAAMLHDHLRPLQKWSVKMWEPTLNAGEITGDEGLLWKSISRTVRWLLRFLYESKLSELFYAYGGDAFIDRRETARREFLESRNIVIEDEHNREFLEQWAIMYELLKLVEKFLPKLQD